MNAELMAKIREIALPMWEAFITEYPEAVTEKEWTFDEFCNEIALAMP